MKRTMTQLIPCLLIASAFLCAAPSADGRGLRELPMDSGWQFSLWDPAEAQKIAFDDRKWRTLDVPHDWSIEGPFDEKNPTGGAGGFLPAGVGWYRKHFTLSDEHAGRRVFIAFDGVMANSDVWINGFHLGRRPYGYVGFRYELTGHLNFGKILNVIAVRADNSGQGEKSKWSHHNHCLGLRLGERVCHHHSGPSNFKALVIDHVSTAWAVITCSVLVLPS